MKVSAPIFLVILLLCDLSHALSCINANGNPASRFFVEQFENAPEGSFMEMFKRSKPPPTMATTCENCNSPEPTSPITVRPIALGEISTEVSTGTETQNSFQIKVERSFWGNYFYRDQDGKKVKLKKQEALDLMTRLRMDRIQQDINQKIAESTIDQLNERRRERNAAINERIRNSLEEKHSQRLLEAKEETFPTVNPQCVERSLNRLRPGTGNKRACQGDRGNGQVLNSTPCITQDISEYITWSINKAFECVNDPQDPLDANLFFKKLNLESNFNFWHQDNNTGKGIGQLTFPGVQEVMGSSYDAKNKRHFKHDGRLMLERIMKSNPKCNAYKAIANPDLPNNESMYPRPYNENHCGLISMDSGLQRNLLASIALYKFYRDEQNTYSSDKVLRDLGIPSSNPDYTEMKNLLALMSYSSINSQRARTIALMMRSRITPNISLEQFRTAIYRGIEAYNSDKPKKLKVPNYLKAMDNKFNDIVNPGEVLICSGSY